MPLLTEHLTSLTLEDQLVQILQHPLHLYSFPTFCASFVGGSTIIPVLWYRLWQFFAKGVRLSRNGVARKPPLACFRFVATLFAAWMSFPLLNKKPIRLYQNPSSSSGEHALKTSTLTQPQSTKPESRPEFAGRTLDLTLFTVTRAADAAVCVLWNRWAHWRKSRGRWTLAESLVTQLADAGVFAISAAIVMWAWIYVPENLPRSYEKWIGEVAKVDPRLVKVLRQARRGIFVYGKDTGQAPILQSMCVDYNWPLDWGDPAKTIPIPCEMVHMGCGPSCEKHAISRFTRTFKFACATYIPLQILIRLRSRITWSTLSRAVKDGMRSSAFLAAFVSIFYYSVCLARTRLGPKLFDRKTITPIMWDSGLCVGAGCLMCGWSILAESAQKRQEIALFVAPRAAATICPRYYDKKV